MYRCLSENGGQQRGVFLCPSCITCGVEEGVLMHVVLQLSLLRAMNRLNQKSRLEWRIGKETWKEGGVHLQVCLDECVSKAAGCKNGGFAGSDLKELNVTSWTFSTSISCRHPHIFTLHYLKT